MMSLIYTADPTLWKEHMGPQGALEKWLKADKQAEWAPFLTEEASISTVVQGTRVDTMPRTIALVGTISLRLWEECRP
jgi:hypothetical protein